MKSTNKILAIAAVLLLITNIILVSMMVSGKNKQERKGPGGKGDPFEMMVKELSMTEQQQKEYKLLKEEHLAGTKSLYDSLKTAKSTFFSLVKEEQVNDSLLNQYSERINEKQAALDKLLFTHFKRVRSLFTAEQQPKFDSFVQKMMQRGRRDSVKGK